ncbi:hypothetical protein BGZ99_009842 [Dissophora globulifera]|uniref:Ppx/GppA phosphatase domain-containing protein n=1 Tax=Dissophora globulifera TaxID=979702 RepID=A0A9P6R7S0_9FUNG|nr:hypothetical protein BGZ99_009842 [Dissophora globulifera]
MPPSAGCLDAFRGLFSPSAASALSRNSNNNGSAVVPSLNGSSSASSSFSGLSGIHAPLAIVDMGSNGIRFGIIASLDRHLPVLYEERASISLFEAQFASDDGDDVDAEDLFVTSLPRRKGLQHSMSSRTAVPAITPSISNSATIAVMGQQDGDDDGDHDIDYDLDDDNNNLLDHDAKEAIRRTLVATDDNNLTITVASNSKGDVDGSLFKARTNGSERQPISEKVIDEVVRTFERWQALCRQANVQTVRVIATEATRTAPNSDEFQARIKAATGWSVELLSKAQEANIGALGVMASYHTVQGLFMDLGGGSVQLNYIIRGPHDGHGKSSPDAQSWPYGAAALSRRLNNCGSDKAARQVIYDEMVVAFKHGLEDIDVAPEVREHHEREGGYRMYLSGGGFRALGYLLMDKKMKESEDGSRYPIPVINGYVATGEELSKVVHEYRHMLPEDVKTCFRVSKRRAKLIPACATLMSAVMEVIPIKDVLFSEGGVRQGGCFGMLPREIQNKDPALETVRSFVRAFGGGQPPLHESDLQALSSFVSSALPSDFAECCRVASSSASATNGDHGALSPKKAAELQVFIDSLPRLIPILVMVMNCYNQLPKEARSTAAWQLFLPGGALANCYGLTHSDRAILATVLAGRHEGDLADPANGEAVKKLIPGGKIAKQAVKYLGKILALAGLCSPLPGTATLLLSGSGVPRHGGGIFFEQSPSDSTEPSNGSDGHNRRNRRHDPDRTRVGDEHSEDVHHDPRDEHGRDTEDDGGFVVLQAGLLPGGEVAHGKVVARFDRGHPLLMAPNVQEAVKSLAQAAAKTHGFTGSLVPEEPSYMNKGKGVHYAK